MRDNYRFIESNTSRDEYIIKKSKRGTRAGRKVKDLKNQKKYMDLILQNLAAQCAQNHKKKIVNENNLSSDKPCNISSHAENSKLYKDQANGMYTDFEFYFFKFVHPTVLFNNKYINLMFKVSLIEGKEQESKLK